METPVNESITGSGIICKMVSKIIEEGNAFEALSCALDAFLLLATVVSVICAFKAYKTQKDRAKKEKACELSQYYAHNILEKYAFVTGVVKSSGILDYIKTLYSPDKFKNFDNEELEKILLEKDLSIENVQQRILYPPAETILEMKLSIEKDELRRNIACQVYIKENDEGKQSIVNEKYLKNEFNDRVSALLNDLEWFAMCCRYGVADEKLMYQSLHQTYISMVWQLYFYIARSNKANQDKFYTNLIWLFGQWYGRLEQITIDAYRRSQKAEERARKEKEKAKARVFCGSALK